MVGLNYLELEQKTQSRINHAVLASLAFTVCLAFFSFVELLTWSKTTQAKTLEFETKVYQLEEEVRDLKTKRYLDEFGKNQQNGQQLPTSAPIVPTLPVTKTNVK